MTKPRADHLYGRSDSADFNMLAPTFSIHVDGTELEQDITQHVLDVEYEHTVDIASMMIVAIENRGGRFGGAAIFEPGQELDLYMGYAGDNQFVGRGEIVRHLPRYPTNEFPVLELRAYDRSWRMGNTDLTANIDLVGPAARRPKKPAPGDPLEGGRIHSGNVKSIVESICQKHGIAADVDDRYAGYELVKLQPKDTSDIEFIRALAAIFDGRFWVEWDEVFTLATLNRAMKRSGAARRPPMGWIGHFWPLERMLEQEVKLEFSYDAGDESSLLNIEFDWGLPDIVSEMEVWIFDAHLADGNGAWRKVVMDMGPEAEPKPEKPRKKGARKRRKRQKRIEVVYPPAIGFGGDNWFIEENQSILDLDNPTRIKLGISGHSVRIEVLPMTTVEEALTFARAWFKQNRNNFVFASGKVIGEPYLRANQVHRITGLGAGLDGDYEFTSVRHRFNVDEGYFCTFTANRHLPDVQINERQSTVE